MSEPKIADLRPTVDELDPGTYYWCRCGISQKQPFCDGSHKATDFTPMVFTITERKRVALCNCKHTEGEPYCDGTHSTLKKED